MFKYVFKRYFFLKICMYLIMTVLLVFASVWFLGRTVVNESRIEQSSLLATLFAGNTAYIEAPGLRTDIDSELLSSLSSVLYFDSEQINEVENLEFVKQIIPLSGSSFDGVYDDAKNLIVPYYGSAINISGENIAVDILPVPNAIAPSLYYRQKLKSGNYPSDNSNQIAVSNYYKDVKIGEIVEYESNEYVISGIIDNSKYPQVLLPYTSRGYEKLYYTQTISDIELITNTQINTNKPVYGNLLIIFNDAPTFEQLEQVDSIFTKGKLYYANYTNFNLYDLLYIKLSFKKNMLILMFAVATCSVLLSILYFLLNRENKKVSFYKVSPQTIAKYSKIEVCMQYLFILAVSCFLYLLMYTQLLPVLKYLISIFVLLTFSNILVFIVKFIFNLIWGKSVSILEIEK